MGRGRETGRERIPSRLWAVSTKPNVGLDLRNHEIMTQAETKSWDTQRLSHPGAPTFFFYKKVVGYQLRAKSGCSLKKRIPWLQAGSLGYPEFTASSNSHP